MDIYGIIYCIENNINGKKYIGQTVRTLEKRVDEHFRHSNCAATRNRALYCAFNKYGKENFISYELDHSNNKEELDVKESYWINFYDTYLHHGYNMTAGEQIEKKNHESEDVSNRMSETLGGKEFSIYTLTGDFIRSTVSQTVLAKELDCAVQSINNCLKGIKTQVKECILIFNDELTDTLLSERIAKYNKGRKVHDFYVFDENDNYIGKWDNETKCQIDSGIARCYIHSSLINNNQHQRKGLHTNKLYYTENCPQELIEKLFTNKEDLYNE